MKVLESGLNNLILIFVDKQQHLLKHKINQYNSKNAYKTKYCTLA